MCVDEGEKYNLTKRIFPTKKFHISRKDTNVPSSISTENSHPIAIHNVAHLLAIREGRQLPSTGLHLLILLVFGLGRLRSFVQRPPLRDVDVLSRRLLRGTLRR